MRIIVSAVVGFVMLALMFRGFELESEAANSATNSTALTTVDSVWQSATYASSLGLPLGMLVAAVAMVLALGYFLGGR